MRHSLGWCFLMLLVAAGGLACSGDGSVGAQRCRTDRDCNGGLCQAGICQSAESLGDSGVGGGDSGLGGQDTAPADGGAGDGSQVDAVGQDAAPDTTGNDPGVADLPGEDAVADLGEQNACGGTAPLEGEPGQSCGVCEDGELVCDGTDALDCDGDSPENLCGGCGPLEALPGTPCPDCDGGLWTCNVAGGLSCLCEALERDGTCIAPFLVELDAPETADLCEQGDDEDPIAGQLDCRDVDSRGQEVVFEVVLESAARLRVDLRDADPDAAIDTVVYLRTDCADAATQEICSDDVPCDESDVEAPCTNDVQVRQSTFETELLQPGTYFIVTDQFTYERGGVAYNCGQVRLEVTEVPEP